MPSARARLAVFYLLMFMAVGVSMPFFPQYFRSLDFSSRQIGVLLAVGPAFALVVPPLWGQLADRWGRVGRVLGILMAGGTAGYGVLSAASTFWAVLLALCLHCAFASAVTTMIDTLALRHVERAGGTYAALRVWGSLGFVVSALGFGLSVEVIDRRAILVGLGCFAAATAWAWGTLAGAPAVHVEGPRPSFGAALALLRRREVAVFLAATALHWIACSPYNGTLAMHVTALKLAPWVVSASASVGVVSEVAVMLTWHRWGHRVAPRPLLIAAFVASAARWLGMSLFDSPAAFVLLAAIHGLTFGAFFLASVAYMARAAPGSLRATGQALFVAVTFGAGGLVGLLATGLGYDALGGHQLFGLAAAAALLPALLLSLVDPREAAAPA